ncbi:MAG: alpha/beta hydrolase [Hyphomicrobiales bacterium]|nr:alpha/beta hydrolase [Hyphomicrobiales bacterium]
MSNIPAMDSYRNLPSWLDYKSILSREFDFEIEREPAERWEELAGHKIHVDEWSLVGDLNADGKTAGGSGTVILVHGGGGNGRILAPLAKCIADLGWRVLAPDLPGFGLTRPATDWRGEYAAWPALVTELADRQAGPVVLIGASMGGLTALHAAQQMQRPPLAVVATTLLDLSDPSTFVRAARWRTLGWLSLLSIRLTPWLMDRLSLPLKIVAPLDAMSANDALAEYFRNDPLLGARWVPLRFWRTAHAFGLQRLDVPCPLILIHPGADKWTPPEESLKTFERITSEKRCVLLPAGSHLPVEPDAFAALVQQIEVVLRNSVCILQEHRAAQHHPMRRRD